MSLMLKKKAYVVRLKFEKEAKRRKIAAGRKGKSGEVKEWV